MAGIAKILAVGHDDHALACVIVWCRLPGVAVTCQTVNAIYVVRQHVRRQPLQIRDRNADGVVEGSVIGMAGIALQVEMMKPDAAVRTILIAGKSAIYNRLTGLCAV